MAERNTIISEFLAASGWKNAIQTHLAGDASFRRYQRISLGQRRAILMNSPPDKENVVRFVFITKLLRSLGYSAPEIYAEDLEAGLILLEDFGDTNFTLMISASVDEKKLYEWGENKVVFPDFDSMISALKLYKNDPSKYPDIGDWSGHLDDLDPFRDMKGGERIGKYIRTLQEAFDEGLERRILSARGTDPVADSPLELFEGAPHRIEGPGQLLEGDAGLLDLLQL
ncbi:MAG TPA: hypothetical protein EYQ03_07595, partial [Nitrospinaceae bacterium]|nr:hypothetical protein [Nitrospinaceae bacterium]